MEMRCYRKILRISYKDHVTNEEVRAKIQQGTGPHKVLLTIVKRRKLQWYGHVSRSSGLAKTILQGLVKGGRRQGRQRKRWEDNIREWTGLEFGMHRRLGSATLSQLAFPGERDPNFPWEKSHCDNTVLKKIDA